MTAFLNQIFQSIGKEKFAKYSPFVSLFADVILLYYIKTVMLPRMFQADHILPLLMRTSPEIQYLSARDLASFLELMQSTFILTFTIFLAFNAIMYTLAGRGKKIGVKFLYGYTLSTSLLSGIELGGSIITKSIPFSWTTLITMFLYLFVYLGMKYFKINKRMRKPKKS